MMPPSSSSAASNEIDAATLVAVDYPKVQLQISQKALALLPLGILAFATATIVAAYKVTFASGVLDFQHGRVTTPPISMLMFAGPGRRMGQVGFPAVSGLFAVVGPSFFQHLTLALNQQHSILTRSLQITSVIAFAGLAIVGAIPLQDDLPQVIQGQVSIRWDSIVHQSAAAVFFLCAIVHQGLWLTLSLKCPPSLPISRKQSPKSFALKVTCFVLCFFPLPTAFLLHPISPMRKKLQLNKHDVGGITQYALVACVATFFASYSCELWYLQQYAQRLQEIQQKQQDAPGSKKTK